jgi:hypothetical protein
MTGDSHGQSKEARCGAQEELKTRQGKRQACAQDCGKAREKSEVQGPASGHECEEIRGQEKAATGDSGKKTSGGGASRNGDLYLARRRARARRRDWSCWHVDIGRDQGVRRAFAGAAAVATTGTAGCCARAASGHAAAASPSSVMNSRRVIRSPRLHNNIRLAGPITPA